MDTSNQATRRQSCRFPIANNIVKINENTCGANIGIHFFIDYFNVKKYQQIEKEKKYLLTNTKKNYKESFESNPPFHAKNIYLFSSSKCCSCSCNM